MIDQTVLQHPVDVCLPVFFCLAEEFSIRGLHQRKQRVAGLLLNFRRQRKVFLVLVVQEDIQAAVGVRLEIFEALALARRKASSTSGSFSIMSLFARNTPS